MTNINFAPVCGLYCPSCDFLDKQCQGCGYVAGKPFWTEQLPAGICPIYDCCHNQKKLEHCGLCPDLPCKIFLELRDPSLNDEEFQKSIQQRKTELTGRKQMGTVKWLQEKSK